MIRLACSVYFELRKVIVLGIFCYKTNLPQTYLKQPSYFAHDFVHQGSRKTQLGGVPVPCGSGEAPGAGNSTPNLLEEPAQCCGFQEAWIVESIFGMVEVENVW